MNNKSILGICIALGLVLALAIGYGNDTIFDVGSIIAICLCLGVAVGCALEKRD